MDYEKACNALITESDDSTNLEYYKILLYGARLINYMRGINCSDYQQKTLNILEDLYSKVFSNGLSSDDDTKLLIGLLGTLSTIGYIVDTTGSTDIIYKELDSCSYWDTNAEWRNAIWSVVDDDIDDEYRMNYWREMGLSSGVIFELSNCVAFGDTGVKDYISPTMSPSRLSLVLRTFANHMACRFCVANENFSDELATAMYVFDLSGSDFTCLAIANLTSSQLSRYIELSNYCTVKANWVWSGIPDTTIGLMIECVKDYMSIDELLRDGTDYASCYNRFETMKNAKDKKRESSFSFFFDLANKISK